MSSQAQPELRIDPPAEPEVPKSLQAAVDSIRDLEWAGRKLHEDGLLDVDGAHLWKICIGPLEALVEQAENNQPARR